MWVGMKTRGGRGPEGDRGGGTVADETAHTKGRAPAASLSRVPVEHCDGLAQVGPRGQRWR